MNILNICVNYQNTQRVNKFVAHYLDTFGNHARVIIVDNSEDFTLDLELQHYVTFGSIQILKPGKNLGYFGGAYYAYKEYICSNALPDYIIVSNVDILLLKSGAALLGFLNSKKEDSRVGVYTPIVRDARSGRRWVAEQKYKLPRWKFLIKRFIFSSLPMVIVYDLYCYAKYFLMNNFPIYRLSNAEQSIAESVYAPCGSFIVFSRFYFENGGTLDFDGFLYGEEIFVAEECRRANLKVMLTPEIVIAHEAYNTTNPIRNPRIFYFKMEAIKKINERYYSDETKTNHLG